MPAQFDSPAVIVKWVYTPKTAFLSCALKLTKPMKKIINTQVNVCNI